MTTGTGESARVAREFSELAAALAGQYALERELGRGGMGVVFLARDLKLDRPVAIKTLLPHLANDARLRERFLREARTAARLSHPNIVPIHRADEIAGQVFFVMGYVEGESLAERVRTRGPLAPAEVVEWLREVARALHAAHARGVIHRDVKAENILLERAGYPPQAGGPSRALVTDFGIARLAEASPLTATGLVLGTVYYMSPEQVNGEPVVDGRSDLYALGVVAYYALSGRFPFESDVPSAVLVAHVTKPAPRLGEVAPSVPPALAAVVDRCLSKGPADRYESGAALAAALGEALGEGDAARGVALAPQARDSAPRLSGSPAQRDLLSETDAQRVWERAAQLQADPAAAPAAGDDAERRHRPLPASASSAYPLDVVRDSAREAGIGTEFIDRALAERALAGARVQPPAAEPARQQRPPAAAPPPPGVVEDRTSPASAFLGATSKLEFEVVIDGELNEHDFDRVVEVTRRALGDVGLVSTVGRSLAWSSADPNRKIQVIAQIRGGRTTVRVTERLGMLAGGLFGGIVGGAGGGAGMAIAAGVLGITNSPLAAFGAALTWVASTYGVSRVGYVQTVRGRDRVLRDLIGELAAEVREAIAERAAPRHRLR